MTSPGPDREPQSNPVAAPAPDPLLRCVLRLVREFGHTLTEGEIRAAAHIPTTGMTVESIERALPRLGFRAKRMDAGGDLAAVPLPFILLPAGRARVMLARDGAVATLYDGTADDELTAPMAELGEEDCGILLLRPAGALSADRGWRSQFMRKVRPIMVEVALASLAINILALAWPLFTMTLYNKVIGQRALATLDVLAVGMLTVFTFDAALRGLRGYVSAHTAARLDAFTGGEVMHHVLSLPYRQFETTTSGVMAERLNQLDVLRSFFAGQLPLLVVDLAFVVLFLGLLAFIHPLVATATIAAMPLIAGAPLLAQRAQHTLIEQTFAARAAKATALAETITNALTIKSLGLEPEIERRWDARLALAAWTGFRTSSIGNGARIAAGLMANLLGLLILFAGARLVIAGEISLGALIACSILAQRAVQPIGALAAGWHGIQEVAAAFRRIDALMALPAEHGGGALVAPTGGTLLLEQVGFTFVPDHPAVLREVTLAATPGQILGVIGPSGSGKSTLIKVMQGLYRPTSGRVLIDDTDIAHLAPEAVRQQIGVVPQEVQLFSGTVRENIALAVPSKDPERVVAVAKFVGAHEFIQRLPQGYETVLGERGGGLSAGQRQLIAVARALMRNPRIILLDEATSALDPVTEETLLRSLKRASRGRTIVLVTHRLAPLSVCDRVALMVDGAITRLGAPAEVAAFARSELGEAAQR